MKHSARAYLLTTATPQATSIQGAPFSTSLMHVTTAPLSLFQQGLALPRWLSGMIWGNKAGSNSTETAGKGAETGNPPLDKLSTACSHSQAGYNG